MLEGRGGGEIKEIDLRWEESSGGSRTLQTIEAQGSTQLTCGVRSAVGDRLSKGFPPASRSWHLGFSHLWEMLPARSWNALDSRV